MKKIINGKLYDTETAKRVGSWSSNRSNRDFSYCDEELYRKRTGEYFLYGEGGPMTKYAKSCGDNTWTGGEEIIPLTAASAREWAEEHLDADDYAEIFGMPDEGTDEKDTLCVQLPADLMRQLRAGASEAGISLTAFVEKSLRAPKRSAEPDRIFIVYDFCGKCGKDSVIGSIRGVTDLIRQDGSDRTEISRHNTEVQALREATKRGSGSVTADGDSLIVRATIVTEMEIDTTGYTDPSDAGQGRDIYISYLEDRT